MPILCKPAVAVPEHVVACEQTLALYSRRYRDHPRLGLALRLVADAGVAERRLAAPLERLLDAPEGGARDRHGEQARRWVQAVVRQALDHAELRAGDIDVLVHACDGGDPAASRVARLVAETGIRADVVRLPAGGPGSAAGAAALNLAHGFCAAHPGANALVVACALDAPRPLPADPDIGDLVAGALRGNGVAAAVVRADGGTGIAPRYQSSAVYPRPVRRVGRCPGAAAGARPLRDRPVTGAPDGVSALLARQVRGHGWDLADLDLCVVHAAAPLVLDELARRLRLAPETTRASRETLGEYGDIGAATVLDALRRAAEAGLPRAGAKCLVAGFGAGAAVELMLGTWVEPSSAAASHPAHAVPGTPGPGAARDRVRTCTRLTTRVRGGADRRRTTGGRSACCDPDGIPRRRHRPGR